MSNNLGISTTNPQVRTPLQGNPIGILAVSHASRGNGQSNARGQSQNRGQGGSPYRSALCRTFSSRNLNADADEEEAAKVHALGGGGQSVSHVDADCGEVCSPGDDDQADLDRAKTDTTTEPDSKKRKLVLPYRQGCVGTLLYTSQKVKRLMELLPGTTLIIRSWQMREATNAKTGEKFVNYNLTDQHGGVWFATNCFIQWRAAIKRGEAEEPDYSTHQVGLYKDPNGKYSVMLVAKPKKKTKPKAKKQGEHMTDDEN